MSDFESSPASSSKLLGVLELTVGDLDRSADWYARLLDLVPVFEADQPARMIILSDCGGGLISLTESPHGSPSSPSWGVRCVRQDELLGWQLRLSAAGIGYARAADPTGGTCLVCLDPDGRRLLFWLPGPQLSQRLVALEWSTKLPEPRGGVLHRVL